MNYIVMPILRCLGERNIFPESVEIPMNREPQAKRNHGQTLRRLKERGGLSPSEAVAIMLRREWEPCSEQCLLNHFAEFGWESSRNLWDRCSEFGF